jgi:hypothetical protein
LHQNAPPGISTHLDLLLSRQQIAGTFARLKRWPLPPSQFPHLAEHDGNRWPISVIIKISASAVQSPESLQPPSPNLTARFLELKPHIDERIH